MEFVNSTVSGNIQAITGLLSQVGIHDPNDKDDVEMPDISDYVVLFHRDLGTAECIHAILQHWAVEDSPWNCCQYVIFVPGLFHLEMAAADALWHVFIHPMAARHDDIRLDCWQSEVANLDLRLTSLEAFADTKPMFTQLKDVATIIAHKYIASNALKRVCRKPGLQHDMQFENVLIINKYMLLYEELTHVMNSSDIGQAELCIVAWILVFKATGKHKYAAYMTEFLLNVHFMYPVGLW
ncbi:hypothetical protein EDD16DRAFT_1516295 [Pisolithus croceorrhizus]|nr:hypothetical protein EDD16DRAFT_1516295 [Pisolithus croceorrhizus]